MSRTSFKEKWENVLSYLKLLAFLLVAGVVGIYFYNRQSEMPNREAVTEQPKAEASAHSDESKPQKPSELMKGVIESNVTPLLAELTDQNIDLNKEFSDAEQRINEEKIKSDGRQFAWNAAARVTQEIRRISEERSRAVKSIKASEGGQKQPTSSTKISSQQIANVEKNKQFFVKATRQKWTKSALEKRHRIDVLFQQILVSEASAPKGLQ